MVGVKGDLEQRSSTRDLRLCRIVRVVELRFLHREVAQGYKLVKRKSAVVRFKVVDEDAYFLAWTTTRGHCQVTWHFV